MLKINKSSKLGKSILQHINYTIKELNLYIEAQFNDYINWDNYGLYWHIDHIIPHSCLDYSTMEEENFKICWSLKNLRPLEAKQNINDGSNRIRHKKFAQYLKINNIDHITLDQIDDVITYLLNNDNNNV